MIFSGVFVWHSQITSTFQPSFLSSLLFFLSLSIVLLNFCFQKFFLVAGIERPFLQLCRCQKQPLIKITFFLFGKTISGQPGKSFLCKLNRIFCKDINFRTSNSGEVPLFLLCDITVYRCDGVRISKVSTSDRFKNRSENFLS